MSNYRTNITPSDIKTDWTGAKRKNNPYLGGASVIHVCPECGHHAFEYAESTGRFHCWSCGIYGNTLGTLRPTPTLPHPLYPPNSGGRNPHREGDSKFPSSARTSAQTTVPSPQTKNSLPPVGEPEGGSGQVRLSDYMPLPDDILDTIQDIAPADQTVTGTQLSVRRWLQAQQIPIDVARQMRWGVARKFIRTKEDKEGKERDCVVFRNYVEGYCCNAKFRCVEAVTKTINRGGVPSTQTSFLKGFVQESSFTPCAPYNIDSIAPLNSPQGAIYYTEGEKDAAILTMLGYGPVISAANGCQTDHARSFEAFLPWLETCSSVTIIGDQDHPGQQMVLEACRYFRDKEVRVVSWDQRLWGKDISEVWQQHGAETVHRLISDAQLQTDPCIEDFDTPEAREEVLQAARGYYDHGYDVGMGDIMDRHFRLSSTGGLIIVSGTPGTGKTDFLNYLLMSLIRQRQSHACFCSFETGNKRRHAGDLAQIWAGDTDLTIMQDKALPYVSQVMSHITHLHFDDGDATPQAILHRAEQVLRRHPRLEYLIIDPYLYVEVADGRNITETQAIRKMLVTFRSWALAHRIHIFIVAHPRKLNKEDGTHELEEIDMYTIAGSANWANIADYVFSLKRVLKSDCDYTVANILKVRDQKLCLPGEVYMNRRPSGRYICRPKLEDAIANTGAYDSLPWPTPLQPCALL